MQLQNISILIDSFWFAKVEELIYNAMHFSIKYTDTILFTLIRKIFRIRSQSRDAICSSDIAADAAYKTNPSNTTRKNSSDDVGSFLTFLVKNLC